MLLSSANTVIGGADGDPNGSSTADSSQANTDQSQRESDEHLVQIKELKDELTRLSEDYSQLYSAKC